MDVQKQLAQTTTLAYNTTLTTTQRASNMNTYVRLVKLVDDCTAEECEQWQRDLKNCSAELGYTYAMDDAYDLVCEDFDSNELTVVDEVQVYDVMGDMNGTNTFYLRNIDVYKHNVSGLYYVEDDDELGVF